MLLLSVGVIVIAIGAVTVVVGASLVQRQPFDPRTTFLRVAAASGVVALAASVMYVVGTPELEGIFADPVADAALVLSTGLMCVAVSAIERRRAQASATLASIAGVTVAVCSAFAPAEIARAVLLYTLAVTCGTCAALALRNKELPARPLRLLAGAMAFYAAYSAARGVALTVLGPASADPASPFGFTAALVASVAVNVVITIAVSMMLIPVARAARRKSRASTHVTISDWPLVVSAYGPLRAMQLVEDLQAATRHLDPFSVDLGRGVATTVSSPIHVLTAPLAYEYGWRPEEIAFLVEDSTAAGEPGVGPSRLRRPFASKKMDRAVVG